MRPQGAYQLQHFMVGNQPQAPPGAMPTENRRVQTQQNQNKQLRLNRERGFPDLRPERIKLS
jgi:hypothetical protein